MSDEKRVEKWYAKAAKVSEVKKAEEAKVEAVKMEKKRKEKEIKEAWCALEPAVVRLRACVHSGEVQEKRRFL